MIIEEGEQEADDDGDDDDDELERAEVRLVEVGKVTKQQWI